MTPKSTRDHLIDVGEKLMRQHGYNATGLNDILKAADVPKGSFYHHFGSKEDFAAAALERYAERGVGRAVTLLNDSKTSPVKRLKRYFMELKKLAGQSGPIPGCMMGRFSLEVAADNPALRKQLSSDFSRWQQVIAKVVEQAIADKELPVSTDPELLAGFLLNSWQGALVRSQADNSDEPLETFIRYVFDGLLTKESRDRPARTR